VRGCERRPADDGGPPREAGAGTIPWASLLALTAGHFAVDCCTGIWPIFKTLAQLDLTRAGMIASAGSMVGNGLQVLLGPLADRGFRRRLLLGGVLLGGAVTLLPLASTYGQMFALVLLTYVGSAAVHPAGTGSAATLSSSRTGVLVGVFLSGGYAGYSLSQIVFSSLYLRRPESTALMALVPIAAATAIVAVLGGGTSTNNVVSVSEGNRRLPGRASGVSALLMGFPWRHAGAGPGHPRLAPGRELRRAGGAGVRSRLLTLSAVRVRLG
jgi:MFS family permease